MSQQGLGQDPHLQVTRINDFSPGIYRYGLGDYPVGYSTQAPLGSAAYSVRCINQRGVGLIPFPKYNNTAQFTTAYANPTTYLSVGIKCSPGYTRESADILAVGFAGTGSSNASIVEVMSSEVSNGTFTEPVQNLVSTDESYVGLHSMSFDVSLIEEETDTFTPAIICGFYNGTGFTTPTYSGLTDQPLVWFIPTYSGSYYFTYNADYGDDPWPCTVMFGHEGRIIVISIASSGPTSAGSSIQQLNALFSYTDPPESTTFSTAGPTLFVPEDSQSWNAWGSVSTGELVLIRQSLGAVIIYGDVAAPTSAIKLPAVVGTGNVCQKMVQCNAGSVYVTENDGVYAWNGGNTSQKISTQIPDDACVRSSMASCIAGPQVCNDVINNLVFFANNWVFDSINNSWWQSEDTTIKTFGVFGRSGIGSRYMYALTDSYDIPGTYAGWNLWAFDFENRQSSWAWLSNPIACQPGNLVTTQTVEIVASNPTATACTITVTPQVPNGYTARPGNNSQTVTFTIPAYTEAMRVSRRLGYTDYNIQLYIQASNTNSSNPGPALHEISIGWVPTTPTAVA